MSLSINIFGNHLVRTNNLEKIFFTFLPHQLSKQKISFNIIFVNEKAIRELNRKYRLKDKSTDVLTFPLNQDCQKNNPKQSKIELGDIYICQKIALKNHRQADHLIVHGFLHLIGLNHRSLQQSIKWDKIEKDILETMHNHEKIFQ